jgi:hypothetical protein
MNQFPSPEQDPLVQLIRQELAGMDEMPSSEVWSQLNGRLDEGPLTGWASRGRMLFLLWGLIVAVSVTVFALVIWWDGAESSFPPSALPPVAGMSPGALESRTPFDTPEEGSAVETLGRGEEVASMSIAALSLHLPESLKEKEALPTEVGDRGILRSERTSSHALRPEGEASLRVASLPPFAAGTLPFSIHAPTGRVSVLAIKEAETSSQEKPQAERKKRGQSRLIWDRYFEESEAWDYQLGARVSPAIFTHSIMRPINPYSSIRQAEVLGEWVPGHHLRFQTGLSWDRFQVRTDHFYQKQADIDRLSEVFGITVEPDRSVGFSRYEQTDLLSIPLEVLVFFRETGKPTQLWASAGTKVSVWRRHQEIEETVLMTFPNFERQAIPDAFSPRSRLAFRFQIGGEQRLLPAHRLRFSAFYQLPAGRNLRQRGFYDHAGISLSWFWGTQHGALE